MAKQRLKRPRARLFVALELPDDVRDRLALWQREEITDPALRATPARNLHLTLVFLGWHAERDVERIADAALGLEAEAPSIELGPEPVALPRNRPRLFAIDAPSDRSVELQERVEERLVATGLHRPEKRPFWPHLTVARVKPEKRGGRKPARVERPPGPLWRTDVRFRPTRLVLFRSQLRRAGAVYEPLAALELPQE